MISISCIIDIQSLKHTINELYKAMNQNNKKIKDLEDIVIMMYKIYNI